MTCITTAIRMANSGDMHAVSHREQRSTFALTMKANATESGGSRFACGPGREGMINHGDEIGIDGRGMLQTTIVLGTIRRLSVLSLSGEHRVAMESRVE